MRGLIAAFILLLAAPGVSAAQQTKAILLFGGRDHKEFLGCMNCSEFDQNSIWNEYSTFSWKNSYGIWSAYGDYKSRYSDFSTCNQYASDPPIMVDEQGNYYGRLSLSYLLDGSVCNITGNEKLCTAVKLFCAM